MTIVTYDAIEGGLDRLTCAMLPVSFAAWLSKYYVWKHETDIAQWQADWNVVYPDEDAQEYQGAFQAWDGMYYFIYIMQSETSPIGMVGIARFNTHALSNDEQ